MRGKVLVNLFNFLLDGITPAYAGKSFLHPRRRRMQKDHPRLCGEKAKIDPLSKNSWGSPPPMRGKGFDSVHFERQEGITPAYAGKSPPAPHAAAREYGSPPPMRGKD